jgi:hypothetical protein
MQNPAMAERIVRRLAPTPELLHRYEGDDRVDKPGPKRQTDLMTDKPLKSSFELAMERLKKKDADEGVEARPLTDAQKADIAEARNFYDAKLAEQEVLYQSTRRASVDPAALEALDQDYRRERERLTTERDAKIARIRKG